MVGPFLSGTPSLFPVTSPYGVTPGCLLLVSLFSLGAGFTGVSIGYLVPMGPTVSCFGKTAVWVRVGSLGTAVFQVWAE